MLSLMYWQDPLRLHEGLRATKEDWMAKRGSTKERTYAICLLLHPQEAQRYIASELEMDTLKNPQCNLSSNAKVDNAQRILFPTIDYS